ncbi:hypothetical protein C1646_753411 [Rhizophagus diaphanus]|nr:hypothetical protein C1646_753411 [Rhizophagus diaphanus] [Rhizophagus sp. MUCL 43196]
MDNNFNFINDGFNNDLRPPTTDSQTENPNVNYNASHSYNNNNSYPTMNDNVSLASYTNTSANATASSQSYPTTSSDPPPSSQSYPTTSSDPPPQYTQQQTNVENNIQQQFFDTTQPITQNVPHFVQNNSSPSNASQINYSEIFTFEIPGIKIIIIPTFPPMINSSQPNHSGIFTFDIPGSKVIIITLTFQ